jgi:hypothetical protein
VPSEFFSSLKTAATSPYALIAYICLLAAWVYIANRGFRLGQISKIIMAVPEKDRAALLAREYNTTPRKGLSAEQWIQSRKHLLLFLAFIALVVAIAVVAVTAMMTLRRDDNAISGAVTPVIKPEQPKQDEARLTASKPNRPKAPSELGVTSASKQSPTQPGSKPKLDSAQTFKDRVVQKNKNSPLGDRERLANAFYEFSESLEQGRALMYKGFNEAAAIGAEGAGIAKDLQTHTTKLRDLASSAKEYGKSNIALRIKWDYYREQTQYVFGDNPDNLGWGKLENAFAGYANHLETWSAIQNKEDQRVLNILAEDKSQFETMLNEFSSFYQGCKARLEEMKTSVSSSGTNSPAIGSITQGPGSAVSINQQGGITAGTVNNFGTPVLPTATVTVCATYSDAVAGEDFQSVVTFTTSSQLPRPWFALFFDGPVLEGNVGRVTGSYGYTHGRAEKLPNPENSFIFRTTGMELGGTSSWFPSDGPIRATVPSKGRVKLIKVLSGGGDDPDVALNVNLVFSCGK